MKPSRYDEILVYQDGEVIAREGDESRDMYIIQSGAVDVLKKIGDEQVRLAVLHRGSFFGEMSLLESLPRSATVQAKGETRLVVVRAGSLLLKIRRDPTFAFEMLQQLSGRIRRLNEQLAECIQKLEHLDPGRQSALVLQAATEYQQETAENGEETV